MKKILSIILILTCVFTLFSCDSEGEKALKRIDEMYNAISPTKIVTETTEVIGEVTLTSTSNFVTGTYDSKVVSVYEYTKQQLRSIDEGATDVQLLPWVETSGKLEYLEGKGVRENGGKWSAKGEDFAPEVGAISINAKAKNVKDISNDEQKKLVSFIIPADNTEAVFGEGNAILADVSVTIKHDGGAITGIVISYTVEGEEDSHPSIITTIKADYYYDPEQITIE